MYSQTTSHQRTERSSVLLGKERGKCLCISVPLHEEYLIEELDYQTKLNCAASRSHYFRYLIRQERQKRLEQQKEQLEWSTVYGEK